MESKGVNITRHCIVRWFNRIDKTQAVTDKSYDIWKKEHEQDIARAEKAIKEAFEKAVYITSGNYNTHRRAEYYVNDEKLITFVVNDGKIVTCYKTDFGLDDEGNAEMLKVLHDSLKRSYTEEEIHEKNKDITLSTLKKVEDLHNRELEEIEAKRKIVMAKKSGIESKRVAIEARTLEIKTKIKSICEKIVKSSTAFEGVE